MRAYRVRKKNVLVHDSPPHPVHGTFEWDIRLLIFSGRLIYPQNIFEFIINFTKVFIFKGAVSPV